MKIRRLQAGDGALFGEIRLEALREEPFSFAAHLSDYAEFSSEDWEQVLAPRTAFVAFDGARPVGIASLMSEALSRLAHRGMVTNVYVSPRVRRAGVASLLLDAVESEARARGMVQLELAVNAENAGALSFYKRRGYQRIGLVPRGFRHGDRYFDEVLFALALDSTTGLA